MIQKNKRLGDLLVEAGLITSEQLSYILQRQKATGKKIGELLIDEGVIQEKQIIEVLEFQLGIPHMDLEKYYIDPEIPKLINENLARRHMLIPVRKERDKLIVAMADPLNIFARDDVQIATGMEVEPVISTRNDITNAIDQYYGKQRAEQAIEEFKKQYDVENLNELDDETLNEINNAPVVRLVNSIISQAVKTKASDIHIEPYDDNIRVRFRIDGELQEIMTPAKSAHSAIVTRIKIMGKMNIAEKRLPQDGRVETVVDGKEIDLRISILPTVYGEKIVIRLLDRSQFLATKKQLGFSDENLAIFDKLIKSPNGIILVTGPTGSGKSTTLYAVLKELNKVTENIVTVEDPVEYKLEGINQVQVNTKAGLTFASGLRAILRQDPDVIMIGEIRDTETAQISVRAAITGHLVLSTMHTNDAPSTIIRLIDMGIEPYLVANSIVGVVAQRLVRKICENCKKPVELTEMEKHILGVTENIKVFKGTGCSSCSNTGYKGRTSVHEVMLVNKHMRMLIDQRANMDEIRRIAMEQGMLTLKENCKQLIFNGITTVDELVKVAYSLE
ncbi:MAG: GspE/PulE family protein [Bacillota bacterium]